MKIQVFETLLKAEKAMQTVRFRVNLGFSLDKCINVSVNEYALVARGECDAEISTVCETSLPISVHCDRDVLQCCSG